jgi:hypothetical protein
VVDYSPPLSDEVKSEWSYIFAPQPPPTCQFRPCGVLIFCMNTGEDPLLDNSHPSACGQLRIHIRSRSAVFKGLNYIPNVTRFGSTSFFYASACTFVLTNLLTL